MQKGSKHSKETRSKISENTKMAMRKPKMREYMSKASQGRALSEETKRKISDYMKNNHPLLGKHHTEEAKKKLRKKNSGKNSGKYKHGLCKNKKFYNWLKNKRNRVLKRVRRQGHTHSYQEWENLKRKYEHRCALCKEHEDIKPLTIDHIVPLSMGGNDFIENIQPLCQSCNSRKGNRDLKYIKSLYENN